MRICPKDEDGTVSLCARHRLLSALRRGVVSNLFSPMRCPYWTLQPQVVILSCKKIVTKNSGKGNQREGEVRRRPRARTSTSIPNLRESGYII